MNVRVRMFALAKQLVGSEEVELALPEPATVRDVRRLLLERFPASAPLLRSSLIAVDAQYVGDEMNITAGSQVAVIPPVSGG